MENQVASSTTLLLIEDNPADAYLFQEGLKRAGANCRMNVARDGAAAWDRLSAPSGERPDLIILDLNLPRIQGHEVLARIKSDPDLCSIPVLIITSSQDEGDIALAYQHGANSYFSKPLDLDHTFELVRMINQYWLRTAQLPHDVRWHCN